jgi:gliding motility-associated-like protein
MRFYILFLFLSSFQISLLAQGVMIIREQDTLNVCAGGTIVLEAEGADMYEWFPAELVNEPSSNIVIVTPTESGYIYVNGTIDDELSTDSVYIEVVDVDVNISIVGNLPNPLCEGTEITLRAQATESGGLFSWYVGNRLIAQGSVVTIPAPRSGFVRVEYLYQECIFSNSISIDVIEFGIPIPVTLDTTICQSHPFRLTSETGSLNTIYTWTPEDDLSDATVPNPLANPQDTTTYKLVYQSQDGQCKDSFEIHINVIPIVLELDISPPILLCLGDSVIITATVNGGLQGLSWGPNDGALSSLTGATIIAKPDYSNVYFAKYQLNGCTLIDSFLIRVDSIPLMPITTIVAMPDYCPGEVIVFLSPEYTGILFPDMIHEWTPQDNTLLSDPRFYNLTIETSPGERTYIRTTTNGGCVHRDSVTIIVKDPQIMVSPVDTIVCPGQPVKLKIENVVTDIQWNPSTGLSCTTCDNPTAIVFTTTTYQVSGLDQGCPAATVVRVRTHPIPLVTLKLAPEEFRYVIGDRLDVTAISEPELPENTVYVWTYNGRRLTSSDKTVSIVLNDPINVIEVTFITPQGCEVTVTRTIAAEPPVYKIPNAFSPNNDEINDRFEVYLEGNVEVISMEIYNRWGQVMYRGNDNSGWDGRFNGSPCPPEVYAYRVTIRLGNGVTILEKGDLTLLR